jgi:sterol 3beta-glucosyltransferase
VGPEGFSSPLLDLVPVGPVVYPPNPNWDPQHHVTGYWFVEKQVGWRPSDGLLAFLSGGEAPIVVSLGAMSRGLAGTRETASLFVDAIQQAGLRAIILGWEVALQEMRVPATIYPSEPLPYGWLLPHTSGIVHHGGFGTTGAGLRAGIPALVIPHFADQFYWGQKVHDLGVGPRPIPRRKLDTPTLVTALKELLENGAFQVTASQLGKQIRSENGIVNAIRLIEETFPRIT